MDSDKRLVEYIVYIKIVRTLSTSRDGGVKFFRVPKDETMCRKWIQASGRKDLLDSSGVLNINKFHNYRICSDHFGNEMFCNPFERSRLLGLAEPCRFEEPPLMIIEKNMDSNVEIKEELELEEVGIRIKTENEFEDICKLEIYSSQGENIDNNLHSSSVKKEIDDNNENLKEELWSSTRDEEMRRQYTKSK